ncbi:prephenate dehydrogenase [Macrococcus animalis]|uniref:prephenate dehydrogenase n=1 Tax=Macrococcus animalis TaxID=3395467 RepID=UPI0039BDC24A
MNIAMIGLGVIGGSFAKAIRKKYGNKYKLMAIDIDQATIDKAKLINVIDYGETKNETILQQADVVIFALYPELMKSFVEAHQHEFKAGAILTDTTGIKRSVFEAMKDVIPDHIDFIFGHPMAGREKKGFDYADDSVFMDANYVITENNKNKKENLDWFQNFVKDLGFKRITITDIETHDAMIAHTSQLAHVIAVSLINSDDKSHETIRYIGDSYRDLTRIANMNETLWSELFMHNKDYLLENIIRYETALCNLKTAIEEDDKTKMEALFKESTQRRLKLEESDIKIK